MPCSAPTCCSKKKAPLIFTFPWEKKKKESTFSLQHVNCDSAHVENGDMPSIRVRKGYFTGRCDGIWVVGRSGGQPRREGEAETGEGLWVYWEAAAPFGIWVKFIKQRVGCGATSLQTRPR